MGGGRKGKLKDQQMELQPQSKEIESEAPFCNDRVFKSRPVLWRELRRVSEEEEQEEEWGKTGGGGSCSKIEHKLPTTVVQHAQQMLYFGRQRGERQRERRGEDEFDHIFFRGKEEGGTWRDITECKLKADDKGTEWEEGGEDLSTEINMF